MTTLLDQDEKVEEGRECPNGGTHSHCEQFEDYSIPQKISLGWKLVSL